MALFCFLDVNPVSLQLDLDRKFQLSSILLDFRVCVWFCVRYWGGGEKESELIAFLGPHQIVLFYPEYERSKDRVAMGQIVLFSGK